jgi:hypothetical protein
LQPALPSWLKFDEDRKRLYGTPTKDSGIAYDAKTKIYYEEFLIKITVSDIADAINKMDFVIIVEHKPP